MDKWIHDEIDTILRTGKPFDQASSNRIFNNIKTWLENRGVKIDALAELHEAVKVTYIPPAGPQYYYETQESAFAPGIGDGWPETIPAPHSKNARLVRRPIAALPGKPMIRVEGFSHSTACAIWGKDKGQDPLLPCNCGASENWHKHEHDIAEKEIVDLNKQIAAYQKENASLMEQLKDRAGWERDGFWRWQGDEYDCPESITCKVVMSAQQLRDLLKKKAAIEPEWRDATMIVPVCKGQRASEDVLIGKFFDGRLQSWRRACMTPSGKWACDGRFLDVTPTHWMPLPKLLPKFDEPIAGDPLKMVPVYGTAFMLIENCDEAADKNTGDVVCGVIFSKERADKWVDAIPQVDRTYLTFTLNRIYPVGIKRQK